MWFARCRQSVWYYILPIMKCYDCPYRLPMSNILRLWCRQIRSCTDFFRGSAPSVAISNFLKDTIQHDLTPDTIPTNTQITCVCELGQSQIVIVHFFSSRSQAVRQALSFVGTPLWSFCIEFLPIFLVYMREIFYFGNGHFTHFK